MNLSYIIEILKKKIELLNQYKDLLYKLKLLDVDNENFTDEIEAVIKKQSFIIDEIKQYDNVYLSLIKGNNKILIEMKNLIDEENKIKKEIDNLLFVVIEKFSNEKKEVKNIIDNIKIQKNNFLSEESSRFFEKKI